MNQTNSPTSVVQTTNDSGSTMHTENSMSNTVVTSEQVKKTRKPRVSSSKTEQMIAQSNISDVATSNALNRTTMPNITNNNASSLKAASVKSVDLAKAEMSKHVDKTKNYLASLQSMSIATAIGFKNTIVGAMLVFLAGLPQFFDPIQFVLANSKTLGKAALHTFAPLVLAWYVAQVSPVLRESLFSDPSFIMKSIGVFSLYALASLTWMLGWMFTRSIFSGLASQVQAFEQVGQAQLNINKSH